MKRRTVLAGATAALSTPLVGCLNGGYSNVPNQQNPAGEDDNLTNCGATSGSDNRTGSTCDPNNDSEESVAIQYTCPEEVERKYVDYEYIRIRNMGEDTVDVTGFTVDYGNGNEYTIPELELEEGDFLEIMSRAGEDAWADMAPRIWYYYAGFGDSNQTSVMDGSGTVTFKNQNGEIIDEYAYEKTDDEDCYR